MRCPELLDLADVSARLGKSKRWIREHLINNRRVAVVRLDPRTQKITADSFDAWLAQATTKPMPRAW